MIVYSAILTADALNALTGTDIQSAPTDGILKVYCASTQADTGITVSSGGTKVVARNITVPQRTVAVNELDKDVPYILAVKGGEQMVIAIDEVTAASIALTVIFIPAGES